MTKDGAMVVFMAGLILCLLGVGGVESSMETSELLVSVGVSCLGLLAMYAGTLGFRNSGFYE